MPLAELSIDLSEETWISNVTRTHPKITVRVLAAIPDNGDGFALLEITATDLESVLATMADHPKMSNIELFQRSGQRVLLQIQTTAPLLLLSAQASGIPIEPPVVIQNGVANVEVRASNQRLSELGQQLERFDHSFTVESIREDVDPEQLLSRRQRDLLLDAADAGYYETPRRCSLTELANEVGIAKSTCSETLHRAEGIIIERFIDRHLTPSEHHRGNDHPYPETT